MGKYGARETLVKAGAICEAINIHSINASVYQSVDGPATYSHYRSSKGQK